jgi:hypothetical protein
MDKATKECTNISSQGPEVVRRTHPKIIDIGFRDHLISIMGKVASKYSRPMIFEEDFMEVAILIEEYRADVKKKNVYL